MPTKIQLIYTEASTGKISTGLLNIPALQALLIPQVGSNIIAIPLHRNIGEMVNNAVYPDFETGGTNFTQLSIADRYTTEPFGASYRLTEIRARLINTNAMPMTFDLDINGVIIPLSNITYSSTLVTYPIPTINQIVTQQAKIQAGYLGDNIANMLEMYIIYTKQ